MKMSSITRLLLSTLSLLCIIAVAPSHSQTVQSNQQQIIEGVRLEVAKILGKDVRKIGTETPLIALGADELDVVEIVMALEDKFNVAIPDDAIGAKLEDIAKTLTARKLAEIVAKQTKEKSDRSK